MLNCMLQKIANHCPLAASLMYRDSEFVNAYLNAYGSTVPKERRQSNIWEEYINFA